MRKVFACAFFVLALFVGYTYFVDVAGAPRDGRHNVETYVRENISSLSPESAVLGGTFYVTKIEATDGRGTVWYEDGHVAFVADFEYFEDKYGVSITSFEVRGE